jgi:hypothetical protein
MDWFGIGESVLGMVDGVLDKVIPDAAEREAAKFRLRELAQKGELDQIKVQMSAILAEANSSDPWTSRARPSFMYVMYALILTAVPMGVLHAFNPDVAFDIATGFSNWLDAIPGDFVALFGVGYLGYAGGRTLEKVKGVTK